MKASVNITDRPAIKYNYWVVRKASALFNRNFIVDWVVSNIFPSLALSVTRYKLLPHQRSHFYYSGGLFGRLTTV